MTANQRLQKYLDIELPKQQLLFRVSMVLSLVVCSFLMLFTVFLRLSVYVPLMLFFGAAVTLLMMYAERRMKDVRRAAVCYFFLAFFIFLPFMATHVPYALYDFPIYFLMGIIFAAVLFSKRWAFLLVLADSAVAILCMYLMRTNVNHLSAVSAMSGRDNAVLLARIVAALILLGIVSGVLTFFHTRILRREIAERIETERQAEQFDYAKNMFLVNMSHEIRTPLNAILGVSELLLEQDVDERIKDSAFHITNSSRALLSITNEIMDFSKLDDIDPSAQSKSYYVGDIVDELINLITVRFADYNLEFFTDIAPDLPEQLLGDTVLVRQVMISVITGVVKSMQSGQVHLRIDREDADEKQVCLLVEVKAAGAFQYSYKEILEREEDVGTEAVFLHRLLRLLDGGMHMDETVHERTYSFDLRQGYVSEACLTDRETAKAANILFYENTNMQSSMFAKALHDMSTAFCQATSDEIFLQECTSKAYTHIMIAAERYEALKERLDEILPPQSLILIGSDIIAFDDPLVKMTFARPVNCLNLDALLRGRHNSMIRKRDYTGHFICPDAHIMVVDDNIVNLDVAASMLQRYQAQVTVASSGAECLRLLQQTPADLILLDYMMPEMDGIDTLKNIRALEDPRCKTVPVAALTANAVSGAREMFLNAGFDEYISKPIEREKFEKVLRQCLPEELIVYVSDREDRAAQKAG